MRLVSWGVIGIIGEDFNEPTPDSERPGVVRREDTGASKRGDRIRRRTLTIESTGAAFFVRGMADRRGVQGAVTGFDGSTFRRGGPRQGGINRDNRD